VNSVYNRVLTPLLADIGSDFNLNYFQIGLIVSAYGAGNFLFQFPISFVADYTGRRRTVLCISLLVSALPVLFYGLASNFSALLVLIFISGIGSSAFHPAAVAMVTNEAPEQRGFGLGLFKAGGDFGSVFTPALSGWLAGALAGWRAATQYFVIPGVVWALLIWFRFEDSAPQNEAQERKTTTKPEINPGRLFGVVLALTQTFLALIRERSIVYILLLSSCRVMSLRGIMTLLPLLLAESFGYDATGVGWIVTSYFLFGTFSSVLLGKLSDKFKHTGLIIAMMVLSTLSLALFPFATVTWTLFPLLVVLGASLSPSMGPILAVMTEVVDEKHRASSVGLLYTSNEFAGIFSPIIGGFIAQMVGLQRTFLFFAAITLIATVVSFKVHQVRERRLMGASKA
jgi:MFS family permease